MGRHKAGMMALFAGSHKSFFTVELTLPGTRGTVPLRSRTVLCNTDQVPALDDSRSRRIGKRVINPARSPPL